jgi:Fic family protein
LTYQPIKKRKICIYASRNEAYSIKIHVMKPPNTKQMENQATQKTVVSPQIRTYIWQSSDWPRLHVDMRALSQALTKARATQGQLVGLLASLNLVDHGDMQLESWVKEAQSSAYIEGEVLQLNSVRASVARRLGLLPSPNRQDVATEGMLDILQAALAQVQEGHRVDHSTLHAWHAALFPTGRSGLQRITVGSYRSHIEPMQIVTPNLKGNDIVHFQAPPSGDVARQMTEMLAWFEQSKTAAWPTDGLVRAAITHLWFETIHPYEDGNGRIGRALAELALFQDWKEVFKSAKVQRTFSLSQQLWLDRKGYYAQLQAATGQLTQDVTNWVAWFIECVTLAIEEAIKHVQTATTKNQFWQNISQTHPRLSPAQRKVLNKLYDSPEGFANGLSTELYAKIASCSRATAYRDLTQLLTLGLLSQSGTGRGTRYRLKK